MPPVLLWDSATTLPNPDCTTNQEKWLEQAMELWKSIGSCLRNITVN